MSNVNFVISVPEKKLNYPVHKDDMMKMLNLVNPKPDKKHPNTYWSMEIAIDIIRYQPTISG